MAPSIRGSRVNASVSRRRLTLRAPRGLRKIAHLAEVGDLARRAATSARSKTAARLFPHPYRPDASTRRLKGSILLATEQRLVIAETRRKGTTMAIDNL